MLVHSRSTASASSSAPRWRANFVSASSACARAKRARSLLTLTRDAARGPFGVTMTAIIAQRARWRLGQLLAEVERGHGPGRGKKDVRAVHSFTAYVKKTLKLEWPRAVEAKRIGTLPEAELERAQGERSDLTLSRRGTKFRAYLKKIDLDKNRAQEAQRIGTLPEAELERAPLNAIFISAGKITRGPDLRGTSPGRTQTKSHRRATPGGLTFRFPASPCLELARQPVDRGPSWSLALGRWPIGRWSLWLWTLARDAGSLDPMHSVDRSHRLMQAHIFRAR